MAGGHLSAALFAALALCAAAQMGFGPGKGEERPPAVKADIPYIKCGVCTEMTKQASRMVKAMREQLKPGKKLDESEVIDKLEKFCNPDSDEGEWITRIDLVEKGDRLEVVDTGSLSRCNSECATIARACEQISEDMDLTELSEALYAGKSRAQLQQLACYDSSSACVKKPPPLSKTRAPGPKHEPLSDQDAQAAKMMRQMKAMGMGGQMYNRDQLLSQMGQQDGDVDEDASAGAAAGTPSVALGSEGGAGVADKVQDVVGQAKEAVTDTISKAGEAVKGAFSKLSSALGVKGKASPAEEEEEEEAEL